jgi:hypothetical protein
MFALAFAFAGGRRLPAENRWRRASALQILKQKTISALAPAPFNKSPTQRFNKCLIRG